MTPSTPEQRQRILEALHENVRRGFLVELSPGKFTLTESGRRHVDLGFPNEGYA